MANEIGVINGFGCGLCRVAALAGIEVAASDGPMPGRQLSLSLENGRLTLTASDVPLATVLRAMARKAGFAFKAPRELKGTYSGSVQNATVSTAIYLLLRNTEYSYMVEFATPGAQGDTRRLVRLSLIGPPLPEATQATTVHLDAELVSPKSAARRSKRRASKINKIRQLGKERSAKAREQLAELVLNDSDEFVRGAAANALAHASGAKMQHPSH